MYDVPMATLSKQETGVYKVRSAVTWSICVCVQPHTSLTEHLQALLCSGVL